MLGKTLQQVQAGTTSTEFLEWIAFMDLELNHVEKRDVYLAQIAACISRSAGQKATTEEYLVKFRPIAKVEPIPTADEIKAKTERSKAFWFSLLKQKGRMPPPKER